MGGSRQMRIRPLAVHGRGTNDLCIRPMKPTLGFVCPSSQGVDFPRTHQVCRRVHSSPLSTTKISPAEKRGGIYPYYAGFSTTFAQTMLRQMGVGRGSRVLDPWNGTGTTTAAARALGATSTGVDINPVLNIVSRARLATVQNALTVKTSLERLSELRSNDLLSIEDISRLYRDLLQVPEVQSAAPVNALALCVLFPAVRKAYASARTKNPSWFSSKRSEESQLMVERDFLLSSAMKVVDNLIPFEGSGSIPKLIESDIKSVNFGRARFDYVLTSPPYLTRVDYVKATYPELTLLHAIGHQIDIDLLRRSMIGTPLTGPVEDHEINSLPDSIQDAISHISAHPSRASKTYYRNFFARYFIDMATSIKLICDKMSNNGVICFVVQPSFYKEILVDLPDLISHLIGQHGYGLEEAISFDASRSMVAVNQKAHPQAASKAVETAIVMRRVHS
jgi:hypothetical protein